MFFSFKRSRALVVGLALGLLALGSATAAEVEALDPEGFAEILAAEQGKVVLINFWATWCRPCLKEIPDLLDLEERYRERGFRLIAVSLDEPGDRILSFVEKWFPALHSYQRTTHDMDEMVSVVDPAWNELFPTSYVLDRKGSVQARIQGGKSAAEFVAAIEPWLAEGAAADGGPSASSR